MPRLMRITFTLLLLSGAGVGNAEEIADDDMRALDEQVQEIKSDVLDIASELGNLEERLLYPSNTQVAVFVEIAENEDFRLDAVQIHINDQLAAHHIYSFKELEALKNGGVQRIFTGNVPTGDHALDISISGKLTNGDAFNESSTFTFAKGIEPKALGITLAGPGAGKSGIELGAW